MSILLQQEKIYTRENIDEIIDKDKEKQIMKTKFTYKFHIIAGILTGLGINIISGYLFGISGIVITMYIASIILLILAY